MHFLYIPMPKLQYCRHKLHKLCDIVLLLFKPMRAYMPLRHVPKLNILFELCSPLRHLYWSLFLSNLYDVRNLFVRDFLCNYLPWWNLCICRHCKMRAVHFTLSELWAWSYKLHILRSFLLPI